LHNIVLDRRLWSLHNMIGQFNLAAQTMDHGPWTMDFLL
jgi:hypothetical protein